MATKDRTPSQMPIPKAPKPTKMTERELGSLCTKEFDDAQLLTTEIQKERTQSMNAYNQEPYGNEEEGLSSFITSDVRDVIEWTLPQLVDVFVGGDSPVVFNPTNDGADVQDAKCETSYSQYVFEQQNKGVIVATSWFKDALMEKNGIVKCWRQKTVRREREEYEGKSSLEYMALEHDDEFEISECTVTVHGVEYTEEEYTKVLTSLPNHKADIDQEAEYKIVGYRKKTVSQTMIENVPPENFVVQKDHPSIFLKDARYCCDYYEKTRSELLEMGYDFDLVMALPASTGVAESLSFEGQTRRKKEGGILMTQNLTSGDRSRELVMIYDHYIRTDFNHDGYAELRHVRTAGKANFYILENEEVDRIIYHAITPYINSFRFFGRSLADNIMGLQKAKSQLYRNAFDNVAYSSIPRKIVSGNVDIAALMTYVQGGIIKKDLNATVENETTPFVADSALAMADKIDQLRSERSGFSKETMGLDPTALANATSPVGMSILAQSQLLVKMIATIFAHSGFQSLMEHIRELVLKYEDGDKVFELTGKRMSTNIRRWRKERSSTVKVGIGFAGKNEELSMMDKLMTLQAQFVLAQGGQINGPLTSAQGIYNTVQRMCSRMNIKDAETYFTDPKTYNPPPPQPTIAEKTLGAQINNMGNQQQIQEAKMLLDKQHADQQHEKDMLTLQQNHALAILKIQSQEKMHEQTLLQQYGNKARDIVEARDKTHAENMPLALNPVHIHTAGQENMFNQKHQAIVDNQAKIDKNVNDLTDKVNDGMAKIADKHAQGMQQITTELKRTKKAKISKDAQGNKTVEIE